MHPLNNLSRKISSLLVRIELMNWEGASSDDLHQVSMALFDIYKKYCREPDALMTKVDEGG